jgi:hypothetical protein
MTTSVTVTPLTLRTVLFGGWGIDPVAALAQSMETAGVSGKALGGVEGLSVAAQREVGRQMATVAATALDVDVIDLVVGGWRAHSRLVSAAKRTLATADSEEIVDLVSHRIRSVHRPYVAVLVDGVQVARLDFEVTVLFDIKALVGVIRAGRLVALRGGQCEIMATLAAEGIPLAQQRMPLDLSIRLPLRTGIQLTISDAGRLDPSASTHG